MIEVTTLEPGSDLASLVREIDAAPWTPASEIGPGDYTASGLQTCLNDPGTILCVARLDGAFAGMASSRIMTRANGQRWLYVDEVDVRADCQRRGIGRAMMRFMLDLAKRQACQEAWLGTETDNAAANALYRSLEPTEADTFVGYLYQIS